MKVLHVSPAFFPATVYGGPITSLKGLCDALARLGCEVRVISTNAAGVSVLQAGTRPFPGYDVEYHRRIFPHTVAPGLVESVWKWSRWADVIHVNGMFSFPTPITLAIGRLRRKPVIVSPRGSLLAFPQSRRKSLKTLWLHWCRSVAFDVTFHATSEEEKAANSVWFPRSPSAVVPNGVDFPAGDIAPFVSSDRLRLLFLGRIAPIKAIENLLAACRLLLASGEERWTLTIAGAGELTYEEKVRGIVEVTELRSHVKFVGNADTDARETLFRTHDVVVLPSHSENFGMVVGEALCRGLFVIASTGTPWRELENRCCGIWTHNSPSALAEAIRRVFTSDLNAARTRGREWMDEEFSWDKRARDMINVYESAQRHIQ